MSYFTTSSLKYYYSGASVLSGVQNDPSKSLGGYLSSTEIPWDSLNSLFPVVSGEEVISGSVCYRAVFLKNTGSLPLYNASAYFGSCSSGVYFGLEEPVNYTIQSIVNGTSTPSGVVWYSVCTSESGISVGDLYPNSAIGVWFKRQTFPTSGTGLITCSMTFCIEGYAL